ncbi:MAG TPA: DUF1015 domain-containing protein, partial [Chloroflexota bacterium]|nr:DUF1015 domain-containing protein [Chloroflexota bacterium]
MADVRPFRGWRFDPSRVDVGAVLCPPYDVISPQEQRAYHERDPHNVVRVELGLGPTDPEAPGNRYLGAARALADWRAAGALIQEPRPALYLYEQQFQVGGKTARRRGLLAAGRLHDPSPTGVLPHEDTRKGPIADRLALLRATATNVSPLWLLYEDGDGRVGEALGSSWEGDPVAVATADGETHRLWVVDDPETLRAVGSAFATRPLYIADGHHRYKTAQVYRDERRQKHGGGDPDGGQEFALMLLVPLDDPGLTVLPTHRLVRLGGRPPAEVRAALEETMTLEPLVLPEGDAGAVAELLTARLSAAGGSGAGAGHAFVLLEHEGAWLLRPRSGGHWRERLPEGHGADWQGLDVAVLDALVIRGAL